MLKLSNLSRVIEVENFIKYGNCTRRSNICFNKLFPISIFLLFSAVCSTSVLGNDNISRSDFMKKIEIIAEQVNGYVKEYAEDNDYMMAEKLINEGITLFNSLSKRNQRKLKHIGGDLYKALATCLSPQNRTIEAVDALEKAIKKYKYNNYSYLSNNPFLTNIQNDMRFIALLESIRSHSNFLEILRQSGKYKSSDTSKLPRFTYENYTSSYLVRVREFFNLDSIAGQGDEISKILNLMTWIHDNIPHYGTSFPNVNGFNSINLYNYHKTTGQGINCRHLAIALNEMYLAMGFKSQYVTCLPKDKKDNDCHVINSVYSDSLQKWLWIDPSFNAYVKDENDNMLSIEEVRERLIDGRTLVLNDDANYNNQNKQTKEWYLDNYMAKNLYWFQRPAYSCFNPEGQNRRNRTYISLTPTGYKSTANRARFIYTLTLSFQLKRETVVTHDASYFWEH